MATEIKETKVKRLSFTESYIESQLPFIKNKLEEILNEMDYTGSKKIQENELIKKEVERFINMLYYFKEYKRIHGIKF